MKNWRDSNTGTTRLYHTIQKRKLLVLITLSIILVLVSILAVGIGSVYIPPGDVLAVFGHALFPGFISSSDDGMADLIVMNYRLPRILLAILAGVALATAGAVMQGLLRNPLVSPFTLGLSSASSFGAALIIVLGPAIFGSLFTGSIILAGVTFSVKSVLLIFSAFIFGWLVERRAWDLNTLSSGDDVAKNLGINVQRFRISGLLIVSFAASACLAFTGIIGFVGLMAPHICLPRLCPVL